MKKLFYLLILLLFKLSSQAQTTVQRKDLLTVMFQARKVNKVDAKEIVMQPGQQAPLHKHPCPVIGYIAEGNLIYQVKGEAEQHLKKGDAFYEPAGAVVMRFDNASKEQALKFIAFYLNKGEKVLTELLTEEEK
ncbi:cupin domain-containing protein [Desertivirga arenae]|uniref:cupin domain-containing protein n=1 Tax=Desertivirga arenae TaxID=2810309 RepID=UPI001A975AAA|nr:cupin domain-containing protein [Pedobacter sp. SYSU D00823]